MGNCCSFKKRDTSADYYQPRVYSITTAPAFTATSLPLSQNKSQIQKPPQVFVPNKARSSNKSSASAQNRQHRGKGKPNGNAAVRKYNYNTAISYISQISSVHAQKLMTWLNSAVIIAPSRLGHEYKLIVDYVNNSQAHSFGVQILSIIKICQRSVLEFRHRPGFSPQDKRMLLWHGTKRCNIPPILENGLRIPNMDYGLMQGLGIYFADRVSKSCNYSAGCSCIAYGRDNHSCKSDGILLLCDVHLGRTKTLAEPNHDLITAPDGFDSVKCPGQKIPEPGSHTKLYGSVVPKGNTVMNVQHPDNYLVFNEYTVYDPDRINIKYLVHFQFCSSPYQNT